jgi:hypothetical protein
MALRAGSTPRPSRPSRETRVARYPRRRPSARTGARSGRASAEAALRRATSRLADLHGALDVLRRLGDDVSPDHVVRPHRRFDVVASEHLAEPDCRLLESPAPAPLVEKAGAPSSGLGGARTAALRPILAAEKVGRRAAFQPLERRSRAVRAEVADIRFAAHATSPSAVHALLLAKRGDARSPFRHRPETLAGSRPRLRGRAPRRGPSAQ